MKNNILVIAIGLSGIFTTTTAHADVYTCHATRNAARGFNFAFQIEVAPTAVGGKISMKEGGRNMNLGSVSEIGRLVSSDPNQKPAFDATLGLIWEKDVSDVEKKDLDKVDAIEIYRAESTGEEVLVYRLFAGPTQIGGTIMISGMATSCVP